MTSQLVEWYKKNKSDKFSIVLVGTGTTDGAWSKYVSSVKDLEFATIKFDKRDLLNTYKEKRSAKSMIMVDSEGKVVLDGKVTKLLPKVEELLK